MITVRTYRGCDAYVIPELWNRALPDEPVSRELFIRKLLLDLNFMPEGFFIAEEDGEAVGFLNAVIRQTIFNRGASMEEDTGYITVFAAAPGAGSEKAGGMLIEAAESYFAANSRHHIRMGYYPVYFTQGINEESHPDTVRLFEKYGYNGARSYAQDIDLTSYRVPVSVAEKRAGLEESGFYIGPLKDEYIVSFLDVDQPFSNPGWSFEFRERLISALDLESIRIAAKDGRVVGACAFGDPNSSPERFGPFGVDMKFQGNGIGTVLLSDTLSEMKKRSLHCAWMQWTTGSGTGAAGTLYKKAGFKNTKSYITFSKII